MRRRSLFLAVVGLTALSAVALQVAAYLHAGALTEFAPAGGERTVGPEGLGWRARASVLLRGVRIPRPANRGTPRDVGLEFQAVCFPSASGHELEAWYVPAESSVLVIAFHGYAASKESLLPLARGLADLGCASLLVDFYGSGGSNGAGTTIGYREAHDVVAAARFAAGTWPETRVALYGVSMGGAAVLRALSLTPAQLSTQLHIQPPLQPGAVIVEGVFDELIHTVSNRVRTMGLPATPFARSLVFWGGWRHGFDASEHNPAAYARAVTAPALVLHGAADPRVLACEARAVYDALAGPKNFVEFPGVGHEMLVVAAPERWRVEVGAHLGETAGF